MQYVKQSVASEDMVQLFDTGGSPVTGLAFGDVVVTIKKEGAATFATKTLVLADWVDRGGGNYSVQFSASEFDTLGVFRYRVVAATPGTFNDYADALYVVAELPTVTPDPPTINLQTASLVGVTPDPVERGATLTINGTNLASATAVTIGGVVVPITLNTDLQIQVTVTKLPSTPEVSLGTGQVVRVVTAGGEATSTVSVVLAVADIPGDGTINITGTLFLPNTATPEEGAVVWGRVLDQPNIVDGVAWKDISYSVATNASGVFSIMFPRNKRVEVMIPDYNYRRVFTTPDLATADLFSEIPYQDC